MEKEQLVTLVTSAQNGDAAATNELFNAFYNDLYYFALKTVKDDDLALDITQETFVEIINTLGNLKEPAAFVTWAKQITYHQCTRYFRKKKDVLVDEDEDGNTVFDDLKEESAEFIPDEALDKTDFKKTILSLLDELSEEQRSAVMMYYFDEMSVAQIAEIQGVSDGTVKSRLNYARKAIKASVEEYEQKNNIKLHAIPFFPFLKWIFSSSQNSMPLASAKVVAEGVSAATGVAVTTTTVAVSGAAATTATVTAVGIGAKIAALPLVAKITAGIVAAAIAVGGGATAIIMTSGNDNETRPADTQSIVSSTNDDQTQEEDKIPQDAELVLEGIIPEGCTYTLHDGTVLTAGQSFPETCTAGDHVAYGDYLYGYECIYMGHEENAEKDWHLWKDGFDSGDSGLIESDAFGAWSVVVTDRTKTSYGEVVSKINGKPIKILYATYYYCENMTAAPKIPSTITSMTASYYGCSSLTVPPVIPSNVERMMITFRYCTALSGDVVINATLDKSLEWFYSQTFGETTQKINLTGATPEEDLILIAKASNNPNLTVNGKFYTKADLDDVTESDDTTNTDNALDNNESADDKTDTDESNNNEQPEVMTEYDLVESTANDYVSRLFYSGLQNFSSVSDVTYSKAFWFAFFGVDKEPYYVDTSADGARYYEIPVSVFTTETKNIFGREYDFTNLYEYDPMGTWQVGYTPVNGGEDVIIAVSQGGAGSDFHPEITKLTTLGNNQYQANISWYSASGEKPTDGNSDYYCDEYGTYWIASAWEQMILETVQEKVGNTTYLRVRIVSYTDK